MFLMLLFVRLVVFIPFMDMCDFLLSDTTTNSMYLLLKWFLNPCAWLIGIDPHCKTGVELLSTYSYTLHLFNTLFFVTEMWVRVFL